ncbi:ATP12 family chaperone protein [Aestuariibius sp. HNIBRBA575]|uniref:ATP12 family chaperone protein n=1 Tax=Aestuariibius sp. HNIBRBA575 TaxID=3233343 RepID=UPI0034A51DFD
MSEWKAKRFWKTANAQSIEGGFGIFLDDRPVKTPAKASLVVPTHALATEIAREWDAQDEKIDPTTMPVTRAANAAIDKVTKDFVAVVEMIAEYGGSDLLCYRASDPSELIARQAAAWDPLLDWAAEEFGGRLAIGHGVMHVTQDPALLSTLREGVADLSAFSLTGFYDLVQISGSLILAFAVIRGRIDPVDAWLTSRIDEDWQIEQWGHDDEADAMSAVKQSAFLDAARFYQLTND